LNTSAVILQHKEVQNTFNLPDGEGIRVVLAAYFRAQRDAVLAQIKGKSLATIETKDIPDVVLPDPGGAELASALEPVLDLIWDEAAQAFGPSVGLDPADFTHDNPEVKASIAEQIADLASSVSATIADAISGVLAKVKALVAGGKITEGEAPAELAKEYEVVFDDMADWKARTIAVTEASRAHHEIQLLMGRDSGIVTGWRWRANADACPICLEIEQDCPVVQEGEAFAILGDDPLYSMITCPPAHPNCLCSLEPVLIDDIQPDTWGVTLIQPAGKKSMPLPRSWRRPLLKAAAPPRPAMRVKFRRQLDGAAGELA
jgi:phenylpyruvate tautomerase PptA (4-oxalocrotonate tautomerase family)